MKKIFDRYKMKFYPLGERHSKVEIASACVSADDDVSVSAALQEKVKKIASEIIAAREKDAAVICAFGAHAIKNGLGRLLGEMLSRGWFTHLASNGAAVIHDWEFAFLGKSSEDVKENAAQGRFGTWEETGLYINLALAVGAYQGLGYGASVGEMIQKEGLLIPSRQELKNAAQDLQSAAALDLLELLNTEKIESGFLPIAHPFAQYSVLASAQKCGKPFTCHPMFGHDIIYTHRASRGAAIGRTAEKDFLEYASSVENLENGVYLSVGSAVMSPMIFEKSLSMARNAGGRELKNGSIHVVDLQESTWDWSKTEPPMDNPAYYLRFMKTFSRMAMKTDYTQADNREFFIALYRALNRVLG